MTHASLFSGIGGAEVAAAVMGWNNAFHCEIQEFPRRVLEYWFPNSVSYEDIKKTDFSKWRGKIHVLTGGFPCQPFSLAGRRKGADDNRYLWPHMLRAIREIQPTWVVAENVTGILTMVQPSEEVEMGRDGSLFEENYLYRQEQEFTFEAICQSLEHAGYSVQPFVIPACAVGAPHKRDRVWIVAHANSLGQRERTDKQESVAQCGGTPDSRACREKGYVTKCEIGGVLLITPSATDGLRACFTMNSLMKHNKKNAEKSNLAEQIAHKVGGGNSQLSPLFVEEMMGFPLMWTTLPFLSPHGDEKA